MDKLIKPLKNCCNSYVNLHLKVKKIATKSYGFAPIASYKQEKLLKLLYGFASKGEFFFATKHQNICTTSNKNVSEEEICYNCSLDLHQREENYATKASKICTIIRERRRTKKSTKEICSSTAPVRWQHRCATMVAPHLRAGSGATERWQHSHATMVAPCLCVGSSATKRWQHRACAPAAAPPRYGSSQLATSDFGSTTPGQHRRLPSKSSTTNGGSRGAGSGRTRRSGELH